MKLGLQTPIPRPAHAGYEPTDPKGLVDGRWPSLPQTLIGGWGSTDERYPRHAPPPTETQALTLTAWRGERVSAQAVFGSAPPRAELSAYVEGIPFATARFVRYVRADDSLVGDILDDAESVALEARSSRSVWVSVEPPPGTRPGRYSGELVIEGGRGRLALPLTIEVLARTLPMPKDWSFYLDLWQNPYALARWHRVKPFSEEHLRLMRPHLRLLADAGQKVLTTTMLSQPWGGQPFDSYGSMVAWTRRADGSFTWDFSLLDRYVAFGKSCGIGPFVNCYSVVPWTGALHFRDERGERQALRLEPGKLEYELLFAPFLKAFTQHLKQKGWLGTTRIAIDGRSLPVTKAALDVVKRHAPQIPIALVGDNNPELKDLVEDWGLTAGEAPPTLLAARRAVRRPTTYCAGHAPGRPGNLPDAPPAESHWIGLWAAAKGYAGFLRGAYDAWTEDPFFDAGHATSPSGECFLVYPGARSSIRFERLREGIQDFEKLRLLREARVDLSAVDAALARLTRPVSPAEQATPQVNAVRAALLAASR